MRRAISLFIHSAVILLLGLATALFLTNYTSPPDYVPPHDPIFLLTINKWFWILAGAIALVSVICLFSNRLTMQLFLLALFAYEYLIVRIGLFCAGCRSLTGYLEGFSRNFAISPGVTNAMIDVAFGYLLIGGSIGLWLVRRAPPPAERQKMPCPACGGHIKFSVENVGQRIDCPHCKASMKLRNPEETLKMDCFFCKEHIKFPAYALGRKINCPHCKMEIGLRESV